MIAELAPQPPNSPLVALSDAVLRVVARKQPGDEIRVWVPGCASGESAYVIALLFGRLLGSRLGEYRLQIFATDSDLAALRVAHRGVYATDRLTVVAPADAATYLRIDGEECAVGDTLRQLVAFSRHDLALDPPFLRLDLIHCHSIAASLRPGLPDKLLSLFHYALVPDGILLLADAGRVPQHERLFAVDGSAGLLVRRRLPVGRPAGGPASGPEDR